MTVSIEYASQHLPELLSALDHGEIVAIQRDENGNSVQLVSLPASLPIGRDSQRPAQSRDITPRFQPIEIKGLSGSATLLADRG